MCKEVRVMVGRIADNNQVETVPGEARQSEGGPARLARCTQLSRCMGDA